jgi:hypothetical protein
MPVTAGTGQLGYSIYPPVTVRLHSAMQAYTEHPYGEYKAGIRDASLKAHEHVSLPMLVRSVKSRRRIILHDMPIVP